ncbi:MAG TPA: MAPEG family protein [Dongiaceae bacterium]|jgi:glutathione S-transferase|nr:MAPEG family protein [Dongiaceae bacterium]
MFAADRFLVWVALVSLIYVLLYMWMGFQVGRMRGKHGIAAPATIGHPEFERAYRVQMNTLEQMGPFLLALWLCALLGSPVFSTILGALYTIARLAYAVTYYKDAAKRGPAFGAGLLFLTLLWLGAVYGAVRLLTITS